MSTRSHSTGGGSEIEPGMTAETNEDWCARDEDSGGSRDRSDASEDEDPFAAFQDSSTAIGFAVGSARESSPEEASASFMSGETDGTCALFLHACLPLPRMKSLPVLIFTWSRSGCFGLLFRSWAARAGGERRRIRCNLVLRGWLTGNVCIYESA